MTAITSIETDDVHVALLVAAHNAALACAPTGPGYADKPDRYVKAFTKIYTSMLHVVGVEEDDGEDEDKDAEAE